MKEEFQARMLRIHFVEADKWHGKPLHEAIIAKCQELGLRVQLPIGASKASGLAPGSIMPEACPSQRSPDYGERR